MGSLYDLREDHIGNTRQRCHKDGSKGVTDFWMYTPPAPAEGVPAITCGICHEPMGEYRYCNRCTPWKNESLAEPVFDGFPEIHFKQDYGL